ncbi:MAG TPA: HisA/HisF-related TIM barrel protein [Candidatus Lokiarchaeia archaeon]|nr:HisA/HisF-related TIM barrel protein [Candidatus Lokiarchaeia archaeon]
MLIFPVLDLLHGQVVHGRQGNRASYKPIKSIICDSADPIDVVQAFTETFDLHQFYVADLDAIQKIGNNFATLRELKVNFPTTTLMTDIGVQNIGDISEAGLDLTDVFILGTETLESLAALDDILTNLPRSKVIISLDLKNGELLHVPLDFDNSLERLLASFTSRDINTILVIDIVKVGSGNGPRYAELDTIRATFPGKIIVGGGVRNAADLAELEQLGYDGALIATAFHSGTLTPAEITQFI